MGESFEFNSTVPLKYLYFSTTIWDVWEVRGCPGFTLSQFINTMEKEYKVKVGIVQGVPEIRMIRVFGAFVCIYKSYF